VVEGCANTEGEGGSGGGNTEGYLYILVNTDPLAI
jgi:hypothetical protein